MDESQEILQRQEDGEIATYWVKRAEWPSAKSAAEIDGEKLHSSSGELMGAPRLAGGTHAHFP